MNIWLQIGLGLLPGALVAINLLIKRRAFCFSTIFSTLLLMAGCGVSLFFGGTALMEEGGIQVQMSEKKMMAFANALAEEGAYDAAIEVLEQYSSEYGYNDECRLLTARIAVLEGDFESAHGLYRYLCENTELISADAEEVVFVDIKWNNSTADLVMIDYLKSVGENIEDYGYTESVYEDIKESEQKTIDDIRRDIKNAIEDRYSITDECSDCAEAVAGILEVYDDVSENNYATPEESEEKEKDLRRYGRTFEDIESNAPEYLAMECVEKARIKAYVISGDYEQIAEKLEEKASYHELMVVAELYMSGLVKESDFSEDYQKIDNQNADMIEDKLSAIYKDNSDDLNKQEKKAFKERIEAINVQLEDPVLTSVKEELTDVAKEEAGTDATKVYLELAKIENYFGNETSTDSYLSTAIYSSPECEDDSYVSAMSQIITVISNDEENDKENIKNVSTYVENVLDHSLTVNVESIVSPQNQIPIEEEEKSVDFTRTTVDYVSRVKSAISIGKIDASGFEKIVSTVQIDSDYLTDVNEIMAVLKVYDCGAEISDFTLKKINYEGSNIMLVCDVSGSMSGNIQDLRDAVVTFITDKNANEDIAVVTFDDTIVDTKFFGTPDDELIAFAQNMQIAGGTDIFSAVTNCLDGFSAEPEDNNVLILMTDGQDNYARDAETIYREIGNRALQKGITVYTMGLGTSVDTNYLSTIAGSGNGEFLYVSDSSSLSSFYDLLHAQVYNQYEITYQAKDTITMTGRTLEISMPDENLRDVKTYSLEGEGEGETGEGLAVNNELSIQGMSPRYIYKGMQDTTVRLKGSGFNKDSEISVKLNGNIDYSVTATYVDAETYELTIPASAAVGKYNVEISIDGKRKVLENGFSVIAKCGEKKIAFGPYVFTASEIIENDIDNRTLRGNVTMNGWLHYKGDVTIVGDVDVDGSVRVTDHSGSYVEYDTATATGFGQFLAKKGVSLDIPSLGTFTLYNDQQNLYDYDNYMVDDIQTNLLDIYNLVKLNNLVVRLYPNSIGLYYYDGLTDLPFQDKILMLKSTEMFEFSCDGSALITNENIGLVLKMEYEGNDDKGYNSPVKFLNTPVQFNGDIKVDVDTIKNEYALGIMIKFMILDASSPGLGAEVKWKGDLIPDSAKLSLELNKALKLPTAVPLEMNDFAFEVSDINTAVANGTWKNLKFTGQFSLTSLNLKTYLPKLEKYIDDVSILSMPETTASIRVSPFQIETNAKLVFLDTIQLAESELQIGNFDYTNALLRLDNEAVKGVRGKLKRGLMWESKKGQISLDLSGAGEFNAHTRFVGAVYEGLASYDIKWWFINSENKYFGTYAVGFHLTHDGEKQFIFAYKYQDEDGNYVGDFHSIGGSSKWKQNKNGVLS